MMAGRNVLGTNWSFWHGAVVFSLLALFFPRGRQAANTDPDEVKALNSIFLKWNISSTMSEPPWNTTGDPCIGEASTNKADYDRKDVFNPGIMCDCSFNNGSICHINRLKALSLGIRGNIPEELQYLKHLMGLNLGGNLLTGPLPAFIGNFTKMEWLSIGKNLLSGPIPNELGNLQLLKSLSLYSNNFSGSLPPELGNLRSLMYLYIDSMGVTGEIPSTFQKLQNLSMIIANGNNFGGRLPDFIGNMTQLEVLILHGNLFQGPIPLSFSNLTNLSVLRLGNLLGENSSLEFIKNLRKLKKLALRDCNIVGSIPSYIGISENLTHLDLSFNGLTGLLPSVLFKHEKLEYLYLESNTLSGNLPSQKSRTLMNIDLSYNSLSGNLPAWVSQDNLNLNLVANNLILDDSNKQGLNCLQQTFPCSRGSPIYHSLAVNCGGNEIDTTNGVHYAADNEELSIASYYVSQDKRWAVSSTGIFFDSSNRKYRNYDSSARFNGTNDQELFQSARLSPSSLRYYGLALENGNYTVTLQFAETAFPDEPNGFLVGKRIFDIYIQRNLVQKDFDIIKEASGSYVAVVMNYTTTVIDNHLEVHLFWAGKGACRDSTQGYCGPSISALNINPNFKPTISNHLPITSKRKKALIGVISATVVSILIFVAGICFWRFKIRLECEETNVDIKGLTALPDTFSYLELKSATEDFSPANKLGEGGFGCVFKGEMSNGEVVAIKELSLSSIQGKQQFAAEVATISAVRHRNLVKLYGCCYEGQKRLLIYEYMENSSLDQALFGKSKLRIDWPSRFRICLDTAKGLAYLHEESNPRIVHRDIKASNILLDADLNPKISDFGLAKFFDEKRSHVTTIIAGTLGYIAPEYAMKGQLTEKADIFSFGILALELLCGRPNRDPGFGAERLYLLSWAWQLHENGRELDMLDPKLASFSPEEATRVIGIAFLCTQANPLKRPPMSSVVAMLSGYMEIPKVLEKPYYMTGFEFDNESCKLDFSSMVTVTSDRW